MIQMKPLFTIIAFAASLSLLLSGCSEVKSDTAGNEEIVTVPVIAEPVLIGTIDATYGTTTSLEAAKEAEVTARVSGVVTSLMIEEGDYVEAGQILAQLDIDKPALELKRATANLKRMENELRRYEKIYQKDLVSSEAYERVKYQYEAQKAATDLATLNLHYATIRAPISGVVTKRYIKEGNLLKLNGSAFHISDLSELHGVIHIPESEKAALDVDQTAKVYVDAHEKPFTGKVLRVSPVVDKESGTIRVTVSLKDKTGVLRPGMFGRVSIVYDTHQQTLLVPKASVLSQDEEVSVFIIKDGLALKRNVMTGFSNSDYIEILEGVDKNDIVIIEGQRNLKDKLNVELINPVAGL